MKNEIALHELMTLHAATNYVIETDDINDKQLESLNNQMRMIERKALLICVSWAIALGDYDDDTYGALNYWFDMMTETPTPESIVIDTDNMCQLSELCD